MLERISITQRQLQSHLTPLLGKKKAKRAAFQSSRNRRWIADELNLIIGRSLKLKDIRLLKLMGIKLSPQQTVILQQNKQEYRRVA